MRGTASRISWTSWGRTIDIVRWNESLQVLIPNAPQPAEIDEVMLCHLLGRAIVLVRDDQLSLAIGRRGQNVRLASKLVGWDIEIMTAEELDEVIDKAVKAFEKIDVVDTELAERLVEQGILSYDDLSVMEIADLVNTIEGLTEEQAVEIVTRAETLAEEQTEELPRRKGQRSAPSEPIVSRSAERSRSRRRRPGRNSVAIDGDSTGSLDPDADADRIRTPNTDADSSMTSTRYLGRGTRFGLAHRTVPPGRGRLITRRRHRPGARRGHRRRVPRPGPGGRDAPASRPRAMK